MESSATEWAYANNAQIAAVFLGFAIVLIGIGLLVVVAIGPDGALAAGAMLALAIFLLVFSVLVFVPRLVRRGAVSFSVYSRRSIDEAEHAVRAVIEASGRTARVERPRSRARSPPRIVIAEEIPARFRLEVTRHAATTSDSGEWTEIIESLPNRQLEEAQALRVKIAERLSAVTSREE